MRQKECVAMLLAGGEGKRLGALTTNLAKPAVHFGGKYRIIDFTLSNCTNSGIDTVGVLTQYQPLVLNSYIGIGSSWDLDRKYGGVTVLPPFMEQSGGEWYSGTANAIYRNIGFVDRYDPEYVLVISGDHIYKMDYDLMLQFHKKNQADATIAVIEVKWEEASRFGIMNTDDEHNITEFEEKPKEPKNNKASMGIYIFSWKALKSYLTQDEQNPNSSKDFGKDIIPLMLQDGAKMVAYPFQGYWKDVGTINSLWEANMDLLDEENELNLNDHDWRVYSVNPYQPPQYIAPSAHITRSLVNEGCSVFGHVDHSVLFYGVHVSESSSIHDSVIMPNVKIGQNVTIRKAIIGEGTIVEDGAVIGSSDNEVVLIGTNERITKSTAGSGAY
ncbi:glucose-1-phosphate adenylyltransferase [Paenibacillus sp. N1-5-1-14]|uniref:glucose-1-phosphate adenylyltransferase n=1 Tax=Paenibacillus radicibacter TaxID=2972488 RepID=UPI0021596CA1|nr:glucose-1-phosphate adenylyltransferase [Paenibacillus radicibacter]MCR8641674.1 glucose-1-phosphate adenylyltransferase [Paenibacillus radicibacter]